MTNNMKYDMAGIWVAKGETLFLMTVSKCYASCSVTEKMHAVPSSRVSRLSIFGFRSQ